MVLHIFLKEEFVNGEPSDIDFGDPNAVMLRGQKTVNEYNVETNESRKIDILFTRYVVQGDNNTWHMLTIQTDLNSTNLELYKQILSTFSFK